jgi:hypothetical protein
MENVSRLSTPTRTAQTSHYSFEYTLSVLHYRKKWIMYRTRSIVGDQKPKSNHRAHALHLHKR